MATSIKESIPTFAQLLESGNRPRVHGNGFLQIDLDEKSRLHIWGHPDIPRQDVNTAIHDHRFSFVSTVLVGRLTHARYNLARVWEKGVDPTHHIYEAHARNEEDTILERKPFISGRPAGERAATPLKPDVEFINAGESYLLEAKQFHETFSEQLTITKMTKTEVFDDHVGRVLVPKDVEPDNEFDRYAFNLATVWSIVSDAYVVLWGS